MPKYGPLKRDMICSVEGCNSRAGDHGSHGMCHRHARKEWGRRHNYKHPEVTKRCDVDGCTSFAISNASKYCGAHQRQIREYGKITKIHITHPNGYIEHPLYKVWQAMKQRCNNPNNKAYKNYGARGIKVCDEWQEDFAQFLADMGDCPKGCSIDRVDVNGDYCPQNCRWVNHHTQNINKRNNTSHPCVRKHPRGSTYCVSIKIPALGKVVSKYGFRDIESAQMFLDDLCARYGL